MGRDARVGGGRRWLRRVDAEHSHGGPGAHHGAPRDQDGLPVGRPDGLGRRRRGSRPRTARLATGRRMAAPCGGRRWCPPCSRHQCRCPRLPAAHAGDVAGAAAGQDHVGAGSGRAGGRRGGSRSARASWRGSAAHTPQDRATGAGRAHPPSAGSDRIWRAGPRASPRSDTHTGGAGSAPRAAWPRPADRPPGSGRAGGCRARRPPCAHAPAVAPGRCGGAVPPQEPAAHAGRAHRGTHDAHRCRGARAAVPRNRAIRTALARSR